MLRKRHANYRMFGGFFDNEEFVFVPSPTPLGIWRWHQVEMCVWNAPNWFSFRISLNNLVDYQPLYSLFVRTLQVRDVSIDDCLNYLERIKETKLYAENEEENEENEEENEEDDAQVYLLYHKLDELIAENDSNAAKDKIRYA